jgi:hypothetical protein
VVGRRVHRWVRIDQAPVDRSVQHLAQRLRRLEAVTLRDRQPPRAVPYITKGGKKRVDVPVNLAVYADGQWIATLDTVDGRVLRGPDAESLALWMRRVHEGLAKSANQEVPKEEKA